MTLAMAREVGGFNITVNCIAPGGIMTPMFKWAGDSFGAGLGMTPEEFWSHFNKSMTIMNRQLYPENIGDFMIWLVSEEFWTLTGQVFYVDGGQKGHTAAPWEEQ